MMSHKETDCTMEQTCPSLVQGKVSSSSLLDQTKTTSFDDVLEHVGSCGKFQITLFLFMSLVEVALAWAMFQPVFIAMTPDWTCESLTEYNNTLNSSWKSDDHPSHHDLCELVANKSCGRIIFFGKYSTIVSDVSRSISILGFKFH
jgi:hypothetical protein